ncbi:MAG TPA: HAD family phosphatase [Gammaproteobacteria bacterium]|nr:HAD family phosphatase [Gammaproteobacteria bacterium]
MTRGSRVRNIIFDFGGVLVNWRPEAIISSFYADPASRDAIRTHAFQHDDWIEMDRGTLDEAEVVRRFAMRMQRPEAEMAALFDHVRASLTPIEPSVALLAELRERGFRLYGLSNMSESIFAYLRSLHGFFSLFDGIVVSAAVKLVKPEPGIYEHLRERFALDFAESVFIDDFARNVESARQLGLPAIRFESAAQVRRELEPLLAWRNAD